MLYLICPGCRAELSQRSLRGETVCPACGRRFPVACADSVEPVGGAPEDYRDYQRHQQGVIEARRCRDNRRGRRDMLWLALVVGAFLLIYIGGAFLVASWFN